MKIAVVGAGFAGLSIAWHMAQKEGVQVTLFDAKGVGGGASGIAAGLAHPYVGEEVRRSFLADEALEALGKMVVRVEKQLGMPVGAPGLVRMAAGEKQEGRLLEHAKEHGDVEPMGDGKFWIKSGWMINCPLYLEGLWQLIHGLGGKFEKRCVEKLEELAEYDLVIVACGAWSDQLVGELPASRLKGQLLVCEGEGVPERSIVGKGYIAADGKQCFVGSTYERVFENENPDMLFCEKEVIAKVSKFYPQVVDLDVLEARASVRLCPRLHREGVPDYFPIVRKEREGVWTVAGLGSRGLLYHALLGQQVADLYQSQEINS